MTESVGLSISGDVASLLGLAITIYVARQVGELRRSVVLHARVPEVSAELESKCETLRQGLKDWPKHERDASSALEQIDGILLMIIPKLAGPVKKKVSEPRGLIKARTSLWQGWVNKPEEVRKKKLWDIHDSVLGASSSLKQLNKDYKRRF
jgi:hypothetical protein